MTNPARSAAAPSGERYTLFVASSGSALTSGSLFGGVLGAVGAAVAWLLGLGRGGWRIAVNEVTSTDRLGAVLHRERLATEVARPTGAPTTSSRSSSPDVGARGRPRQRELVSTTRIGSDKWALRAHYSD